MPERESRLFTTDYREHFLFQNSLTRRDLPDTQSTLHFRVSQYLSWLAVITPGASQDLSPAQRIEVALAAVATGYRPTAERHQLHHQVVKRAVRDVLACLWVIQYPYKPMHQGDAEILRRIETLRQARAEKEISQQAWAEPVKTILRPQAPPVWELLQAYWDHRTAESVVNQVGVTTNPYQLRSVRRYLLEPDLAEALDGISSLTRRYVLARWLRENWSYSQIPADDLVAAAAVFVLTEDLSSLPAGHQSRLRSMGAFLSEMLHQEFEAAVANLPAKIDWQKWPFMNQVGLPTLQATELDPVESYAWLAKAGQGVAVLKAYAQWVVDEVPQRERAIHLLKNQPQSDARRKDLDWAGVKFLENILLWAPSPDQRRLETSVLTSDLSQTLKAAHQLAAQKLLSIPPLHS